MSESEIGRIEAKDRARLSTDVFHKVDSLRYHRAPEETWYGATNFGNSGVKLSICEGYNISQPGWALHFVPEGNAKPIYGSTPEDQKKKIKYARMFAAGMLELVKFFQNFDLKNLPSEIEPFYEKYSTERLGFYTNATMKDFAQKMFGKEVFLETKPPEEHGMHYISFELKKSLSDLQLNRELLKSAEKFADPEKLSSIWVKNLPK